MQPDYASDSILDDEQRAVFMEVIEESLRITQRTHLFNWLQRGVQYLIGHEVMLFGVKSPDDMYDYEYLTSSRYFTDEQFHQVLEANVGVVKKALIQWRKKHIPILVTSNAEDVADYNDYSVIHFDEVDIKASELKQFVVHGFGDARTRLSSVIVFGRLSGDFDSRSAHLLSLLIPYIHCALIKVTSSKVTEVTTVSKAQLSKKITRRESEVLQWLYMGKTNWEISNILAISPLTVKNHVQNIIRKLNVENRSQAAAKAAKLGLIVAANVSGGE